MKPIKPIWQSLIAMIIIIIVGALALCLVSAALADLTPTEARANLQAAVNQIAAEQAAAAQRAKLLAARKAKAEQKAQDRADQHQAAVAAQQEAQNARAEAERARLAQAAWIAAEPARRREAERQQAMIAAWRAQLAHTPNIIIFYRAGRVIISVNGKCRVCTSQVEAEQLADRVRHDWAEDMGLK